MKIDNRMVDSMANVIIMTALGVTWDEIGECNLNEDSLADLFMRRARENYPQVFQATSVEENNEAAEEIISKLAMLIGSIAAKLTPIYVDENGRDPHQGCFAAKLLRLSQKFIAQRYKDQIDECRIEHMMQVHSHLPKGPTRPTKEKTDGKA